MKFLFCLYETAFGLAVQNENIEIIRLLMINCYIDINLLMKILESILIQFQYHFLNTKKIEFHRF